MIIDSRSNLSAYQLFHKEHKVIKAEQNTGKEKTKEEIYTELRDQLKDVLDPVSGMTDEEKSGYEEKINRKLKSGEALTEAEIRYIRVHNPYMYAIVLRVQMQREAFEHKLENCRSKEEVEEAYHDSMMRIDTKDPAREPLYAAYHNVLHKFKESDAYKCLPLKTEEEEKEEKPPENEKHKQVNPEKRSRYHPLEDDISVFDIVT